MDLSKVSTKDLVEELSKREAVEKIMVEPYKPYEIVTENQRMTEEGPAVLLRIWD